MLYSHLHTLEARFLKNYFTTLEAGRSIYFFLILALKIFGKYNRKVIYFNDKAFVIYLAVLKRQLSLSSSLERNLCV